MAHIDIAQNLKRRRRIRTQFRAIIRTIIINKVWISMQEEQPVSVDVRKNLAIITRKQRQTGILTINEKALIRKPLAQRTIEERKKILKLVISLKCFAKYSPKVRARIAPHLIFIYIQADRTLIKEGDTATTVYFILNGEIVVTNNVFDQVRNEIVPKLAYVAGSGETIGESAFVENRKRASTLKVTKDVEALCLEGDIYKKYMLEAIRVEWTKKREALNSLDYFKNWTVKQIGYACENGFIKQYEPMETIYHEDKGILNFVYFILSGECMILQCLKMRSKVVYNRKQYELCEVNNAEFAYKLRKSISPSRLLRKLKGFSTFSLSDDLNKLGKFGSKEDEWDIENHFTDVGSLRYGAIFGVGEKMEQRAIMARTMVQCLLLPRFWLYAKPQNPGNMWQRLKFHLNATVPSREFLFKDFLSTQKWQEFKKNQILSSLDKTRIGNPTKTEDIPLICRIIEPNFNE